MSEVLPDTGPALRRLPLVTLYVTERCNSRCFSCDYWKHGRFDVSLDRVAALVPSLEQLGTRIVVLSGGEPLLHPEWQRIAEHLQDAGFKVWLLTAGLALAKHARRAARVFDDITVSMDGTNPGTYAAIRGLDAFATVCAGVRAAAAAGVPPALRVTLQRANFRHIADFVDLARDLGARRVSFLAVDVANTEAFGRGAARHALSLRPEDLPIFESCLDELERTQGASFRSGFIAESPDKLRRILQHFAARTGRGQFPAMRCNAPDFSAVVDAAGAVQPCFFIAGPAESQGTGAAEKPGSADLVTALNRPEMQALRRSIRAGARAECRTCVCSMWRDPVTFGAPDFPGTARETAC